MSRIFGINVLFWFHVDIITLGWVLCRFHVGKMFSVWYNHQYIILCGYFWFYFLWIKWFLGNHPKARRYVSCSLIYVLSIIWKRANCSPLRFAINKCFATFCRFYFWPAVHHPINCSPCTSKITDTSVRMPPICLPHLSLLCFSVFLYVAILFFVLSSLVHSFTIPNTFLSFLFFNSVPLSPASSVCSEECSVHNPIQRQTRTHQSEFIRKKNKVVRDLC